MLEKLLVGILLLAVPALADMGLFHEIHRGDKIVLVRRSGECEAKVLGRAVDQLTVRPTNTTAVCGDRAVSFTVLRDGVTDVVDNKRRAPRAAPGSLPAICASAAAAVVGSTAGFALGSTGHGGAALAVVVGSFAGGAFLCRDRSARYTIFVD